MKRSFPRSAPARLLVLACVVSPFAVGAQAATSPAHPKVCTDGVKQFYDRKDIPTPFDTLEMPQADQPIRVTSEEEAAAAERLVLERAGSVGATGLLVVEEREESPDGMVRMHRSVTPVFAPSDTARAYAACRKK